MTEHSKLHIEDGVNILQGRRSFALTGGHTDSTKPDDGRAENEANAELIVTAVNNHQMLVDALKDREWQPIETAPKDGSAYLGVIAPNGQPFIAFYEEEDGHQCQIQTEPKLHKPTHWMPLPQPPTKETK